jgi:hypothetical protein
MLHDVPCFALSIPQDRDTWRANPA